MVTTYYNQADIEYACAMIRRKGEEPIIYASRDNIADQLSLIDISDMNNDLNIDQKSYNGDGFIGVIRGNYVYATDAVGDLWVVVPRCKENLKDE